MTHSFVRLAIVTVAMAATPQLIAQAVPAASAPGVSAATVALARDLVVAMHADSNFLQGIEVSLAEQRKQKSTLTPVFFDSLSASFRRVVPEMLDSLATAYAARFSEEDLRALAAFYRSPTGVRYAASQAEMTTHFAEMGRRLGMRVAADVIKRLTDAGIDFTTN
ncbi:MAG: DUF2059 domain-containing protein [Gemmatimonadales bacterium]